jgi:predicted AAA+ superfamily ATPase
MSGTSYSSLKPWREIAHPRADVLHGTFQQSEFAADLSAVAAGRAPEEYRDAEKFFARTFITAGMAQLLTAVAQRLNGRGGDPVVQLQTNFGGGKTHTLLAVWHLATRNCELSRLKDVPALVDKAGLTDVPKARAAVLDGIALAPNEPRKHGRTLARTLWGELAWQLGGAEAFAKVAQSDAEGTSPGKEILREVLASVAPCVVLLDEFVAYIRQFHDGARLAGGTYESNMTFVQTLTEAAKQVPDAVVLASLPASVHEAGGERGAQALTTLEAHYGRVSAAWRVTSDVESFEIVRRRLFEDVGNEAERDAVCDAFARIYRQNRDKLPVEAVSDNYRHRLAASYPLHPEVFDRLYQDWSELGTFQRTRGVLKLLAKTIHQLWRDGNSDLLIMPGSLPLETPGVEEEFLRHVDRGWSAVIAGDIKGRADTIDDKVPRFGEAKAARRVARTLFLGTAPSSVALRAGVARGLDNKRALLGCLQPERGVPAVFDNALGELANQCHHLYAEGGRHWFDVRPTLRRVMEERKQQVSQDEIGDKVRTLLTRFGRPEMFDGAHVFTPPSDVPDDTKLRLVFLPPSDFYQAQGKGKCADAVKFYLRHHGNNPRVNTNRLLFVATDSPGFSRLAEQVKTALAWKTLGDEAKTGRLVVDNHQMQQIENETRRAEETLPRAAREAWKWLLCPAQFDAAAGTQNPWEVETEKIDTTVTFSEAVARVCADKEWVIDRWSPVHLRDQVLRKWYWSDGKAEAGALRVWEDMCRYVYLPRLRNRQVFENVVAAGAASRDFFGLARGIAKTGTGGESGCEKYEGFHFGGGALGFSQVDDTLLLVAPEIAGKVCPKCGCETCVCAPVPQVGTAGAGGGENSSVGNGIGGGAGTGNGTGNDIGTGSLGDDGSGKPPAVPPAPVEIWRRFHGSVKLPATPKAKMDFGKIYDEVIAHLAKNPNANVSVTVEIAADFSAVPAGAGKDTKRIVETNAGAGALNFTHGEWE